MACTDQGLTLTGVKLIWVWLILLGEGGRPSACEGSLEVFGFPVGCSLLSHGGEGR